MKLLFYVLLNILFLTSSIASAAHVGNIGSPLLWGEGFLASGRPYHITASIDFDSQKNDLPEQLNRVIWNKSGSNEFRHYEQFRSSKNEYFTSGITIGATIKESNLVYLMAGAVNSTIDFTFADETIGFSHSYRGKFKSDNDFYYGIGWSAILHEGVFLEETPVRFGMDTKYRKLEMEDADMSGAGKFYSTSLDEFQFALILSAEIDNLYPYFGFRISSITGREHFIDKTTYSDYYPNKYIDYRRAISWFKNTGYLTGISYYIKELVIVNIEYRSGSEVGVGFSATIKF